MRGITNRSKRDRDRLCTRARRRGKGGGEDSSEEAKGDGEGETAARGRVQHLLRLKVRGCALAAGAIEPNNLNSIEGHSEMACQRGPAGMGYMPHAPRGARLSGPSRQSAWLVCVRA